MAVLNLYTKFLASLLLVLLVEKKKSKDSHMNCDESEEREDCDETISVSSWVMGREV